MTVDPLLPLIVIVGPTASGKTAAAIELAKKVGGEVICADSRTVYREMDIGTAKPTMRERQGIPHWGLDLVNPNERFTAADFKEYAQQKISEIRQRGRLPIVVGGTGLYVDGIIFDYQFGGDVDITIRTQLEQLSVQELQLYCVKNNILLPENRLNKRYLIRAIEQKSINKKRQNEPIPNSIVVGITTDKFELRNRIYTRFEQMFSQNVVEEAIKLGKKYGWDGEAMTGNIYRYIRRNLEQGKRAVTKEDIEALTMIDMRLVKRQLTWFKRNPFITWASRDHVVQTAQKLLVAQVKK